MTGRLHQDSGVGRLRRQHWRPPHKDLVVLRGLQGHAMDAPFRSTFYRAQIGFERSENIEEFVNGVLLTRA
jgi:hypothetical protein